MASSSRSTTPPIAIPLRNSDPTPSGHTDGVLPPPRLHLHGLIELPADDQAIDDRVQRLMRRQELIDQQIESHVRLLQRYEGTSPQEGVAMSPKSCHVALMREHYRAQLHALQRDNDALRREIHCIKDEKQKSDTAASSSSSSSSSAVSTTTMTASKILQPQDSKQWVYLRPPSPRANLEWGYTDWIYSYLPDMSGSNGYIYDSLSSAMRYVVDPKDRFKGHRYLQYALQILHTIGFQHLSELRTSTQKLALKRDNPDADFFSYVYTAVMNLLGPAEFSDPRDYYHSFQAYIRKALLFAQYRGLRTPAGRQMHEAISSICAQWAGESNMVGFLTKAVQHVVKTGNSESLEYIQSDGPSLSSKIDYALVSNFECLSPPYHQLLKKMGKVMASFEPTADTNMPWRLDKQRWKASDGSIRTLTFVRSPVPVGPKSTDILAQEFPWELEGIWLVPEILAAFQHFQQQKKKVLWFCHLDTAFLDQQKEEVVNWTWGDAWQRGWKKAHELPLKKCEAFWSKLLIRVSRLFPDTVELFFLTQDALWLSGLFSEKSSHRYPEDVKAYILNKITEEKSECRFPKSLGEGEKLKTFLQSVLDQVHKDYFPHPGPWEPEMKQAFWGHFCGALQVHAALKLEADYIYGQCTDGADRTKIPAAARMATAMLHAGSLRDPKEQERFMGLVLGTALMVWKRWPLRSRINVIQASIRHIERLIPSSIKPWTVQGHRFVDIDLGQYDDQPLVPGPALSQDLRRYMEYLNFEINNPVCLPKAVPAPELYHHLRSGAMESAEGVKSQLALDLKNTPITINGVALSYSSDTSVIDRYLELMKQMKLSDRATELAMTFATKAAMEPVMERLSRRYNHGELGFGVFHGSGQQSKVRRSIAFNTRGKSQLMVVKRSFPLCRLQDTGEKVTIAEIDAVLTIDLQDPSHCPTYTWTIR